MQSESQACDAYLMEGGCQAEPHTDYCKTRGFRRQKEITESDYQGIACEKSLAKGQQ